MEQISFVSCVIVPEKNKTRDCDRYLVVRIDTQRMVDLFHEKIAALVNW